MTTGKFRHMPVVEQGKLVGIVSIGDVVKNRVEEIEREAAAPVMTIVKLAQVVRIEADRRHGRCGWLRSLGLEQYVLAK